MSILTQIFEDQEALNNLEKFTSINGAIHYNLKINNTKIKLKKSDQPCLIPNYLKVGNSEIVIFKPDFPLFWNLKNR